MWIRYNPNPMRKTVGDCVIRGIAKATGMDWESVYNLLCNKGAELYDMPSSNFVWAAVLRDLGFQRFSIPNACPDCYTVRDFANDHPRGVYILGTGTHVITCKNGDYFDAWDSGGEVPIFYFKQREENNR